MEQSAGYNDLALNCMDILTSVIGAVEDAELLNDILSALCAALRFGAQSPLRLGIAAGQLVGCIFATHSNFPFEACGMLLPRPAEMLSFNDVVRRPFTLQSAQISHACILLLTMVPDRKPTGTGLGRICRAGALNTQPLTCEYFYSGHTDDLVEGLVDLLSVGLKEAVQAMHEEIGGSCGPAEVRAADATAEAVQQAARVLQAKALAAASQVCCRARTRCFCCSRLPAEQIRANMSADVFTVWVSRPVVGQT